MSVKERVVWGLVSHEPDSGVLGATNPDPENLGALHIPV